jgi:flavin reductase (DIM6/NTAB) family NADH-FMN oxidoreductase RutF/rubredoxin
MDTNALFKIGYGLYILTANEGEKDNGCIINTVMQVTSEPCQIAVAINKQNYTCDMVSKTRKFNVSIMTEKSQFDEFKRFGYQSGKTVDKFSDFNETKRSPNGVLYITKNTNAYLSAYVKQEIDLGSHLLFIAQLVEAEVLNGESTVSYEFYQKNIKSIPQKTSLKGWRCKICGFIYENEVLPPDYICPVCKHGAADFEKI